MQYVFYDARTQFLNTVSFRVQDVLLWKSCNTSHEGISTRIILLCVSARIDPSLLVLCYRSSFHRKGLCSIRLSTCAPPIVGYDEFLCGFLQCLQTNVRLIALFNTTSFQMFRTHYSSVLSLNSVYVYCKY
jgi:hypothetical protein